MAKLKYKDKDGFWQELPVGTNVVANPTLTGTEQELTSLQVGNAKYKSGGGKLYLHYVTLSGEGYDSSFCFYSTKNGSFTIEELGNIFTNKYFPGTYSDINGYGVILAMGNYTGGNLQVDFKGVIANGNTSLAINISGNFNDMDSNYSDTVVEV